VAKGNAFRLRSVDGNLVLVLVVDVFACRKRSLLVVEKEFTSWLNRSTANARNVAVYFMVIDGIY